MNINGWCTNSLLYFNFLIIAHKQQTRCKKSHTHLNSSTSNTFTILQEHLLTTDLWDPGFSQGKHKEYGLWNVLGCSLRLVGFHSSFWVSGFSKTLEKFYQTTWNHILGDNFSALNYLSLTKSDSSLCPLLTSC